MQRFAAPRASSRTSCALRSHAVCEALPTSAWLCPIAPQLFPLPCKRGRARVGAIC